MRYGERSPEVRDVQRRLVEAGYPLDKFGVDAHLGDETWEALHRFAVDNDIEWNPAVPPRIVPRVPGFGGKIYVDPIPELDSPADAPQVKVFDLRSEQENPPKAEKKFKLSAGKVVRRNVRAVTGITVHQTAVPYSVRDYQVEASDGNVTLALARRALDVACHVMAFRAGFVAWVNPLDWYVYHGNGFNSIDLGIEIDGRFPGLIGTRTWDDKPATVVDKQVVNAARAGIELLVREGRALGMPIEFIHAHRQASQSRRADPGEELWKRVVTEWAVPKLGLKTEPLKTLKNGRPIPIEWDDDGFGNY